MNLLQVLMITSALLLVNQSYASPSYAECEYLRGGSEIWTCQVEVDKREEKKEQEGKRREYDKVYLWADKHICNEKAGASGAKSASEENAIYEKCMREHGH